MKYLIVVDVQNDFVDGVLGTAEARAMLPALLEKVRNFDGTVLLTKDTHTDDYLHTQEGKNLPVPHCIRGTDGWEFPPQLAALAKARRAAVYEKSCFGSTRLASDLAARTGCGIRGAGRSLHRHLRGVQRPAYQGSPA